MEPEQGSCESYHMDYHGSSFLSLLNGVNSLLLQFGLILSLQVVEKLVDVVTFIHQEISEAFGDNGMRSVLLFVLFWNLCRGVA